MCVNFSTQFGCLPILAHSFVYKMNSGEGTVTYVRIGINSPNIPESPSTKSFGRFFESYEADAFMFEANWSH